MEIVKYVVMLAGENGLEQESIPFELNEYDRAIGFLNSRRRSYPDRYYILVGVIKV